jgi:hypothetical protein
MPKLCDHCWKEIPTFASKCPYCLEDPDSKGNVEIGLATIFESFASYKFWVTFVILIPIFGLVVFGKRDDFFLSLFVSWISSTVIYIFFFRKSNNVYEEESSNLQQDNNQKYSLYTVSEQNQLNKKLKITRISTTDYDLLRLKINIEKEVTLTNFKVDNYSEVIIEWNNFKNIYLNIFQKKGIQDIENLYGTIIQYNGIQFLNSFSDKDYEWYHKLFCDTSFTDEIDIQLRNRDRSFDIKNDMFYELFNKVIRDKNILGIKNYSIIEKNDKISQLEYDESMSNKTNILIERLSTTINNDILIDDKYMVEFI